MRRFVYTIVAVCIFLLAGCIKNDLPHPVVDLQITSIDIDGIIGSPVIDEVGRTVTVELYEQTDIQNVEIKSVTHTEGATASQNIVDYLPNYQHMVQLS